MTNATIPTKRSSFDSLNSTREKTQKEYDLFICKIQQTKMKELWDNKCDEQLSSPHLKKIKKLIGLK